MNCMWQSIFVHNYIKETFYLEQDNLIQENHKMKNQMRKYQAIRPYKEE